MPLKSHRIVFTISGHGLTRAEVFEKFKTTPVNEYGDYGIYEPYKEEADYIVANSFDDESGDQFNYVMVVE